MWKPSRSRCRSLGAADACVTAWRWSKPNISTPQRSGLLELFLVGTPWPGDKARGEPALLAPRGTACLPACCSAAAAVCSRSCQLPACSAGIRKAASCMRQERRLLWVLAPVPRHGFFLVFNFINLFCWGFSRCVCVTLLSECTIYGQGGGCLGGFQVDPSLGHKNTVISCTENIVFASKSSMATTSEQQEKLQVSHNHCAARRTWCPNPGHFAPPGSVSLAVVVTEFSTCFMEVPAT